MTTFEWFSIGVPFLTGLIQVGAILWGIRTMGETGQRRDQQLDVMAESLREQSAGIRALLERTA